MPANRRSSRRSHIAPTDQPEPVRPAQRELAVHDVGAARPETGRHLAASDRAAADRTVPSPTDGVKPVAYWISGRTPTLPSSLVVIACSHGNTLVSLGRLRRFDHRQQHQAGGGARAASARPAPPGAPPASPAARGRRGSRRSADRARRSGASHTRAAPAAAAAPDRRGATGAASATCAISASARMPATATTPTPSHSSRSRPTTRPPRRGSGWSSPRASLPPASRAPR